MSFRHASRISGQSIAASSKCRSTHECASRPFYADLAPAADLTAVTGGMSVGPLEKEREDEEDMPQIDDEFEEDLLNSANISLEGIRASKARADAIKSDM